MLLRRQRGWTTGHVMQSVVHDYPCKAFTYLFFGTKFSYFLLFAAAFLLPSVRREVKGLSKLLLLLLFQLLLLLWLRHFSDILIFKVNKAQISVVFETPKEKVILKKVLLQKDFQKCQPVVPVCTTIVQAPIPKEHDLSWPLTVNNRGSTVVQQPQLSCSQPSGQVWIHGAGNWGVLLH